jgi:hypothetical protein
VIPHSPLPTLRLQQRALWCLCVRRGQLPMLQYRYPPSLLRIISSRRLLQEGGLLHFFDTDAAWQYK